MLGCCAPPLLQHIDMKRSRPAGTCLQNPTACMEACRCLPAFPALQGAARARGQRDRRVEPGKWAKPELPDSKGEVYAEERGGAARAGAGIAAHSVSPLRPHPPPPTHTPPQHHSHPCTVSLTLQILENEFGGMNEVLYNLYSVTGNSSYAGRLGGVHAVQ